MNQYIDNSHSIDAAMKRDELTEEEAYFVLRFAGRVGYEEAMKRLKGSPLKRLRKWFVWFGGWETPELMQWDRGKKSFEIIGECGGKRYLRGP